MQRGPIPDRLPEPRPLHDNGAGRIPTVLQKVKKETFLEICMYLILLSLIRYQEKLHKIQTSNSINSETTDYDVGVLCCSFQVSKIQDNFVEDWSRMC